MSYPFRFYGRAPSDWYEGANDGHLYEVQFREPPDDAAQQALAERFEAHFAAGPARAAPEPWLWSERFARFAIGERWSGGSARPTFSKVADFLLAAHRIAPIDDVLFWGRREPGTGRWDAWSEAQQAAPSPGPAYPNTTGMRGVDPTLPIAAPDDAFEAHRAQARKGVRAAKLAAANADADIELTEVDAEAHPAPATPEAARTAVGEPNAERNDDGNIENGNALATFEPRIVAWQLRDGDKTGLCYVADDDALREVALPEDDGFGGEVPVHGDRDRGVLRSSFTVYEVDFTSAAIKPLWKAENGLLALAYLGDLVLARTNKGLVVLDVSEEPAKVMAQAKRKGFYSSTVCVARDGTILTVQDGDSTGIYGYAEGKLKKLAEPKVRVYQAWDEGGAVYVRGYQSNDGGTYRLDGVDDVYEAWAQPLRARAEKARLRAAKASTPSAAKKGRAKLALEPRETMPAPPKGRTVDDATKERMGEGWYTSAGDTVLGVVVLEDCGDRNKFTIAYRRGDGDVVRFDERAIAAVGSVWEYGQFSLSRDGAFGLFLRKPQVILDVAAGTLAKYVTPNGPYGRPEQMVMLDPESLVVRFEPGPISKTTKGRRVELVRRTKEGWRAGDHVVVSKSSAVAAHGKIVAVLSEAATRMVLFGVDGDHLHKLGGFKEPIIEARFDGEGRLFVQDSQDQVFEVTGLAEVAEAKAAAAARKRSKDA